MTITTQDKATSRIKEIDGWRAVSVLLVIFHHLGAFKYKTLMSAVPVGENIAHYAGPLGVEIFFVISGFVICRMLLVEERKTGWISLKGFYFRRMYRILPALWLYLVTCAVLLALGCIRESWVACCWAGLFLFDLSRVPMTWFFGHTWSLAIEEQFYLVFPLLWVLLRSRWRSKVFTVLFFACAIWNLEAVAASPHVIMVASAPPGFAGICFGVLMAIHEKRARSFAKMVPGFVVAFCGCILILRPVSSFDWRSALYDVLVVPPLIALLLLFSMERGESLRRFLKSRVMQVIGVTSYGIYLWQQLFTAPVDTYFKRGASISWLGPVGVLIVAASYLWIERPAIQFGQTLSNREKEMAGRGRFISEGRELAESNRELIDI